MAQPLPELMDQFCTYQRKQKGKRKEVPGPIAGIWSSSQPLFATARDAWRAWVI